MSIERTELRLGLLDLLGLYQRCGMTHLPTAVDDSASQWARSILASNPSSPIAVASTQQPAEPHQATSSIETPIGAPNHPETAPAPLLLAAEPSSDRQSRVLTESVGANDHSTWSLPILPLPERAHRFAEIHERIKACRLCTEIVGFRHQTVLGDGNLQPTICFMGEAPGADEDRVGLPFVGKAGQLLTRIIEAMSLQRSDVYILNALKCRPPQNRTPMPEEIDHCRPFVEAQLDILQPKFIVCLGAVAVRSLLKSTASIGQLRGKFHRYRDARVVVTYHPAYLLRNEAAKKLVWEDMQMLMRELGLKPRRS